METRLSTFQNQLAKDLTEYKQKIQQAISKGMIALGNSSGGGEVNLRYLDDVNRNTIADGYVLSYNQATEKFIFVEQTGGGGADETARSLANSAFGQANTATTLAQAAYNYANTIISDTQIDSFARSQANSAFNQANTATSNAATANNQAASAFSKANTATTLAQSAYDFANTIVSDTQIDPFARSQANSAFDQANTATTNAAAAQSTANSALSAANNLNYVVTTVSSNTTITSANNGNIVVCNSESAIYISISNSIQLDDGFNFKIYPINSGPIYVICSENTDKIATGTLRRESVILNRNAEVVKLANTLYALFE